jgi:hypothetical protein
VICRPDPGLKHECEIIDTSCAPHGELRAERWTPMTHTPDPNKRASSPLDFPEHLDVDERAALWAELLCHEDRVTDAHLDQALYEMMDESRRSTRARPGRRRSVC